MDLPISLRWSPLLSHSDSRSPTGSLYDVIPWCHPPGVLSVESPWVLVRDLSSLTETRWRGRGLPWLHLLLISSVSSVKDGEWEKRKARDYDLFGRVVSSSLSHLLTLLSLTRLGLGEGVTIRGRTIPRFDVLPYFLTSNDKLVRPELRTFKSVT